MPVPSEDEQEVGGVRPSGKRRQSQSRSRRRVALDDAGRMMGLTCDGPNQRKLLSRSSCSCGGGFRSSGVWSPRHTASESDVLLDCSRYEGLDRLMSGDFSDEPTPHHWLI